MNLLNRLFRLCPKGAKSGGKVRCRNKTVSVASLSAGAVCTHGIQKNQEDCASHECVYVPKNMYVHEMWKDQELVYIHEALCTSV